MNEEISFERGDLVRWYENYHDIATTKDTGLGVILEKHEYSFKDADLSYTNYKVYTITVTANVENTATSIKTIRFTIVYCHPMCI